MSYTIKLLAVSLVILGAFGCGSYAGQPDSESALIREVCGNGIDDDHNGLADDRCACLPGQTQRCFIGNGALAGIGSCTWGTQTCLGGGNELGLWTPCSDYGIAAICSSGGDNNGGRTGGGDQNGGLWGGDPNGGNGDYGPGGPKPDAGFYPDGLARDNGASGGEDGARYPDGRLIGGDDAGFWPDGARRSGGDQTGGLWGRDNIPGSRWPVVDAGSNPEDTGNSGGEDVGFYPDGQRVDTNNGGEDVARLPDGRMVDDTGWPNDNNGHYPDGMSVDVGDEVLRYPDGQVVDTVVIRDTNVPRDSWTGCQCIPGRLRWCDTPTACAWGLQQCLIVGTWGACNETNLRPAACLTYFYNTACCVAAGQCCQNFPRNYESVGNCAGILDCR